MRDYARLDAFLDARLDDIYPEPLAEPHGQITKMMVADLIEFYAVKPGATVLDVGIGPGLALELFRDAGCAVTGVGFGEEAAQARAADFEIIEQDMSFLDVADATYDVVWARHVIEHSVFPFYTLSEMHRLLKPGGIFYMEVPAPGTCAHHEDNANHYSVMSKEMWVILLHRTGFPNVRPQDFVFELPMGKDTYHALDAQKPA